MITFDADIHLKEIVLVGVGGTGSQLARSISRMLYDMQQRNLETPLLHLVDHDVVERKNVGRQMFTVADVGRFKAEVLGERFSRALGLEIVWHTVPFVHDMFDSSHTAYGAKTLVVGAVDNHLARRALAKADHLWIDCGNFFSSGQVVIGNTAALDRAIQSVAAPHRSAKAAPATVRLLPNAAALFPALLEPEPEDTPQPVLSCADLVSMGEQHLLINDHVAAVAANYVYKLLHRQPIQSFISYVDLDGMNVKSIPITLPALQAFLPVQAQEEQAS